MESDSEKPSIKNYDQISDSTRVSKKYGSLREPIKRNRQHSVSQLRSMGITDNKKTPIARQRSLEGFSRSNNDDLQKNKSIVEF